MTLFNGNLKKICFIGLILLLVPVVTVYWYGTKVEGNGVQDKSIKQSNAEIAHSDLPLEERVNKIVEQMSLEEKIGQMVMIGIRGTAIDDGGLAMLNKYHIGGVVLFDRNMQSKEQVRNLTAQLQKQASGELPLFISVDEEGGVVVRMAQDLTPPPSQQEIGASGDSAKAFTWAVKTANELKNIGINVNFAPVADIGGSRGRAYSDHQDVVTEFVQRAADGYEQEKFMYSLKHFPGIGKTKVDPHVDAYKIQESKACLESEDLVPFKAVIQQRKPENYFIMVSHLTYVAFDEQNPASLSAHIITDLLRKKMGYTGLIITDDMEMGALTQYYGFKEMGVKAVEAGVDIVLVCHEYQNQIEVYNGILEALQNGAISKSRIDESVKRIVKAKLLNLMQP